MKLSLYVFALLMVLGFLTGCSGEEKPLSREEVQQLLDESLAEAKGGHRAEVEGKLELPDGESPVGVMIFVPGTPYLSMVGSDGLFELSGLEAGQFQVYATRHDLVTKLLADVVVTEAELAEGPVRLALEPQMLEFLAPVSALAVGSFSGAGVAKGSVLVPRDRDLMGVLVEVVGTDFRTTTDSQGQFTLVNLPAGPQRLRYSQSGYVPFEQDVVVESLRETLLTPVQLQLRGNRAPIGRSISGGIVMVDVEGNVVRDYSRVQVLLEGSPLRYFTDDSGLFEIGDLDALKYRVSAKAPGYKLEQVIEVDLSLQSNAQITLVMLEDAATADQTGVVVGQVFLEEADDQSNAGVLVALAGTPFTTTTDAVGSFTLEGVEPGTYSLVATMQGFETKEITGLELKPRQVLSLPPFELKKIRDYPIVVSTIPADGERDVTIKDPLVVSILFDEEMDLASVEEALSITPEVEWEFSSTGMSSERVELKLAGFTELGTPLKFGERYTVKLENTAKSIKGQTMEESFSFRFETGKAKVVETFPRNGQRNVFVSKGEPIRVYFNVRLRNEQFESSDVRFRPELPASADVYLQEDRRTGWSILMIGGDLLFDTEYEVTIPNRFETITKGPISNLPYRFRFTTTKLREATSPGGNREVERRRIEEELKRQ